jgi:hypothetical protein
MVLLLSACNSGGGTAAAVSTSSSSGGGGGGAGSGSSATTDVLTYHNDTVRSGQNLTETVLTPANVISAAFGKLRILSADHPVDATPLIARQVAIGGSAHNLVYVATEHDTVYAYDADSGALLAQVSLLAPARLRVTPTAAIKCNPRPALRPHR